MFFTALPDGLGSRIPRRAPGSFRSRKCSKTHRLDHSGQRILQGARFRFQDPPESPRESRSRKCSKTHRLEHSGQRILQGARFRFQDPPESPRERQKQKLLENTPFGAFWTEDPAGRPV